MKRLFGEPERDAELAAALRSIEQAPVESGSDLLHRRIAAAARPGLAALATPAPRWWELLSAWSRLAVPVGLAVALAAGLLMPSSGEMRVSLSPDYQDTGSDTVLVVAAFSEEAVGQLANFIAPASHDWVLEQAISQ
jgi:hypothetical protein